MREQKRRAEHERLKRVLVERRRVIESKRGLLRSTLAGQDWATEDASERHVNKLAQDMDFALMRIGENTSRAIDDAIERLDDGTYGACAECGTKIAPTRLRAIPFARLCRVCQELEESRRRLRPPDLAAPEGPSLAR